MHEVEFPRAMLRRCHTRLEHDCCHSRTVARCRNRAVRGRTRVRSDRDSPGTACAAAGKSGGRGSRVVVRSGFAVPGPGGVGFHSPGAVPHAGLLAGGERTRGPRRPHPRRLHWRPPGRTTGRNRPRVVPALPPAVRHVVPGGTGPHHRPRRPTRAAMGCVVGRPHDRLSVSGSRRIPARRAVSAGSSGRSTLSGWFAGPCT